ncbi:MAG: GNAT family N-acetyltransferase [Planctomycetota bacterium]|nr:GNAT family N-acetyltransferase [Planctomycetota bacterium]
MERHGWASDGVLLRAKTAADVAPGLRLIQRHGALLEGLPSSDAQEIQGPNGAELNRLWVPWRQPGLHGPVFQLAIVDRATGRFQGSMVVRTMGDGRLADLGYWVDPEAWGQGIGGQAVRLAQWWAFERLGVDGLSASVHPANDRSLALLSRLGFDDLGPIPGQSHGLLAHNQPRFRWPDREGGWNPEPGDQDL